MEHDEEEVGRLEVVSSEEEDGRLPEVVPGKEKGQMVDRGRRRRRAGGGGGGGDDGNSGLPWFCTCYSQSSLTCSTVVPSKATVLQFKYIYIK